MSPLHEAAQAGHAAVVRKLLECGADAHQKRVVSPPLQHHLCFF
jgi:ankyrin repeat protein